MNIIEVNKNSNILPIAKNTAYKWHHQRKYPKLIFKVAGKLFWNVDEWDTMAKIAMENQVAAANCDTETGT